jgi:hypothetical protein
MLPECPEAIFFDKEAVEKDFIRPLPESIRNLKRPLGSTSSPWTRVNSPVTRAKQA